MTEWQGRDGATFGWSDGGPVEVELEDGTVAQGELWIDTFYDGEDEWPEPVFEVDGRQVYGIRRYRMIGAA